MPRASSHLFQRGTEVLHTIDTAVAGAVIPTGPTEILALADEILRGAFRGDFGIALDRAAAFCRVTAAGRDERRRRPGGRTPRPVERTDHAGAATVDHRPGTHLLRAAVEERLARVGRGFESLNQRRAASTSGGRKPPYALSRLASARSAA